MCGTYLETNTKKYNLNKAICEKTRKKTVKGCILDNIKDFL